MAIERTVPSQNVRDRWHWIIRTKDRDAWALLMRAAVKSLPLRPRVRMHVHVHSLRVQLIKDNANLRGGAKGLVDAIVRLGFIHDDSDQWARITYGQTRVRREFACTRITIAAERSP